MTYPRRGPNRRDRWKARVQRDRKLYAEARLFLVATLAGHMRADGKVSWPRKKLAAEHGVSERMVSKYISAAKDAGWLIVVQPGFRTMTAVYEATFPNEKGGTDEFTLFEPERGNYKDTLSAGTDEFTLLPQERGNSWVPTTSSSTTRTLRAVPNAQSARRPSSLRLSSPTGRDAKPNEWLSPRHLGSLQPGRRSTPSGAAPLSGLESCKGGSRMRPDECQVEKQKRNEGESLMTDAWGVPPRCDSPGCFQGVTWMRRYCGRCGGSGYLTPADQTNHTIAARAGRAG